jgi:hypothetical protein
MAHATSATKAASAIKSLANILSPVPSGALYHRARNLRLFLGLIRNFLKAGVYVFCGYVPRQTHHRVYALDD